MISLPNFFYNVRHVCLALVLVHAACGPDSDALAGRYSEAQRLYTRGDREGAAKILRAVLESDPAHAGAHIMLGKLDYVAGQLADAEQHFQTVVDRRPENLDGLLWLARVRGHENRDLPGALAALDAVLAADSGNTEAWYLKGNLHERQGDLEQAMASYRYGMESRKHLARIYLRLSAIYAQADLPDESRRYLEDAAVLARDDPYLRKEVEAVRKAGR